LNPSPITHLCFPHVRFNEGEKRFWSPVVKQAFKIRPEERVRLEVVEFLNRRCGISYNRMSTEQGLRTASSENTVRTDILVRDRDANPVLLVECKAPDIKLNERAAIQISQYNTSIKAPGILLTNGHSSYLFKVSEKGLIREPLESLIVQEEPERDRDYWAERGFAAKMSDEFIIRWLNEIYEKSAELHYFDMQNFMPNLPLSHYYRLQKSGKDSGWAIGIATDNLQKNWLIGLQFIKGSGNAIVAVDIIERITYYRAIKKQLALVTKVLSEERFEEFNGLEKALAYKWFDRLLTEII